MVEKKDNVCQASEKVYKRVKDNMKALTEKNNSLEEYQQALREGRWYISLLSSLANRLINIFRQLGFR